MFVRLRHDRTLYRKHFAAGPKHGQLRVAVLMGGRSSERGASMSSGGSVCLGLKEAGHFFIPVYVDVAGVWRMKGEVVRLEPGGGLEGVDCAPWSIRRGRNGPESVRVHRPSVRRPRRAGLRRLHGQADVQGTAAERGCSAGGLPGCARGAIQIGPRCRNRALGAPRIPSICQLRPGTPPRSQARRPAALRPARRSRSRRSPA